MLVPNVCVCVGGDQLSPYDVVEHLIECWHQKRTLPRPCHDWQYTELEAGSLEQMQSKYSKMAYVQVGNECRMCQE